MSNIEKIRQLVENLTMRDNTLLEKVEHLDILEELFRKSPQATAIMENNWKYILLMIYSLNYMDLNPQKK